jgi:hypothetical protein
MDVGAPSEVGDADDLRALGDHRGEKWVFGVDEVADRRDRHRSVARELARFVSAGIAAEQCRKINPGEDLGPPGRLPIGTPVGAAGELDERVGGVGLLGLAPTLPACTFKEFVTDGRDAGHDPGDDFGVVAQLQHSGALIVGPRAQMTTFMDSAPTRLEVADAGLCAGALVL